MFLKGTTVQVQRQLRVVEYRVDHADFPDSWNLAATYKPAEDYSDSDHSDDEDQSEAHRNTATTSHHVEPSTPYREFLQFLEHACSGSPAQGYPTVVIILSTIASPVR